QCLLWQWLADPAGCAGKATSAVTARATTFSRRLATPILPRRILARADPRTPPPNEKATVAYGEGVNGQPLSPGCWGSGAATLRAAFSDGELSKSNMSSKSLALVSLAVSGCSAKRFSTSARNEVWEFTTCET